MSKLKVVAIYTPNFESLFRVMSNSLCRDSNIELMAKKVERWEFDRNGFGEDSWYRAAELKLAYLLSVLLACKDEYLVFTDCDIQYFQPKMLHEFLKTCIEEDLDFYGVQDVNGDAFNGGFYLIKNCPLIRDVLTKTLTKVMWLPKEEMYFAEQDILNWYLRHEGCRYKYIPPRHCAMGTNYLDVLKPEDLCFHHAIYSKSVVEKIHQMHGVYIWYYTLLPPKQHAKVFGGLSENRNAIKLAEGLYVHNPFEVPAKVLKFT